jgi:hypothetical protein
MFYPSHLYDFMWVLKLDGQNIYYNFDPSKEHVLNYNIREMDQMIKGYISFYHKNNQRCKNYNFNKFTN